jgi:hypothetical protein
MSTLASPTRSMRALSVIQFVAVREYSVGAVPAEVMRAQVCVTARLCTRVRDTGATAR